MVIARDKVGKPLNGKGVKRKDVSAAHMTKMARQALERHPEWREVARKIMRARMGDIKLSEAAE